MEKCYRKGEKWMKVSEEDNRKEKTALLKRSYEELLRLDEKVREAFKEAIERKKNEERSRP